MTTLRLSQREARRLHLAAQGLGAPLRRRASKADVLAAIQRIAALQIDSISVVAKSPYFVLWSRLGEYEPRWLDELLAEGKLFEHWAHAACFLPIEHYPYYRQRMLDRSLARDQQRDRWLAEQAAVVERVIERVRAAGPVRSAEFERPGGEKGGGWWEWKDEKVALELLFDRGDLMIARRQAFQRLYDLRERVLPGWDDSSVPSAEESRRQLALESVRALGIATPPWVADYLFHQRPARPVFQTLADLVRAGTLREVAIEGIADTALVRAEDLAMLDAVGGRRRDPRAVLLSPFDPVACDRRRALELFGFDYRIECYTPAPQRRYGYFSLPILYGDDLVGRLDAKAHRRAGAFEVRSLHLEPGVKATPKLAHAVAGVLRRCAAWHRTPEVVVRQCMPPCFAAELAANLDQ